MSPSPPSASKTLVNLPRIGKPFAALLLAGLALVVPSYAQNSGGAGADAALMAKAATVCVEIFRDAEANKLLPPAPFTQKCLADAKANGNLDFVSAAKESYFDLAGNVAGTLKNAPTAPAAQAVAPAAAATTGKAAAEKAVAEPPADPKNCPHNCSGHGRCKSDGCHCVGNFTGNACQFTTFPRQ